MATVTPHRRTFTDDDIDRPLVRQGLIDVHTLAQIVRGERLLIAAIMIPCLVLAIVFLHLAAPKYAVRMVVTGVQSHSQGGGALDDLSSIAGIDIGGMGNTQFQMFIGAMRSPFAAQSIAADPELLKAMFPRDWSVSEGRWREPPGHLRRVMRAVAKFLGWHITPWSPPGVARVFDYLKRELKVVVDTKSGVVTMEIDSQFPDAASRLLLALNHAVDDRIRQRDLQRASSDVDYLSQRLSSITVQEYRLALVTNLVQQEKQRMLASAPLPYVSDTLGKPLISAEPVSPVPVAVLAAALILGGLLGVGVATIKFRRQ
jgi:uncharacterized protein involved in exopolysaccharide biosynthesis